MRRNKIDYFKLISEASRYSSTASFGLTDEQVELRKAQKLINVSVKNVSKSYFKIFATNILSFFNILLFVISGFLIAVQSWSNLFFLVILLANITFGIVQDIKARRLLDRMRLVNSKKAKVIRNGKALDIEIDQIVLDDVVVFNAGDQIFIDSTLLQGKCSVDESALTGESRNIEKALGETLYSGTYLKSGVAHARVEKLGPTNYIETLQSKAKSFARPKSEIIRSINGLFLIIGMVVIVLGGLSIVTNLVLPGDGGVMPPRDANFYRDMVTSIAGSMVSMIPAGMYLLTSIALTTSVLTLSKHKTSVNELYSIEMLSRVDVICLDKTGTLTDGTLVVEQVVPFGRLKKEELFKQITEFVSASSDSNITARTLREYFTGKTEFVVDRIIPFSSDNKYSAISFASRGTYILGAVEMVKMLDREVVLAKAQQYSSKGYRVLGFFHSTKKLEKDDKLPTAIKCLGLIVMSDHIKDDAYETIKWFMDNGVDVKIVSGDNAQSVSVIARQTGIKDSDKFISLEGYKPEDIVDLAERNTVFGRVTPEQKELIVASLRKTHTVAMVGDGVNDILALKRADCSIAMANGSEAARDVSHLVLLDSNFSSLPLVVGEGRKVINNLQRTCSLFLSKTFFAIILTVIYLIMSFVNWQNVKYPFEPRNMMVWEIVTIGIASFFLALQPSKDKIKGKFLGNTIGKAIPAALCLIFGVTIILIVELLAQELYGVYDNFPFSYMTSTVKITLLVSTITFSSLAILFKMCLPFNKYRFLVFIGLGIVTVGVILACGFIPAINGVIGIDYRELATPENINYLILLIAILVVTIPWYLGVDFIFDRGNYNQLKRRKKAKKNEAHEIN